MIKDDFDSPDMAIYLQVYRKVNRVNYTKCKILDISRTKRVFWI